MGLMWTCMTLYNRPQVCFTPELQPEWLLALICIFVGCICITTAIILLASSNWDRDVIPYARWVGFTASKCLCLVVPPSCCGSDELTISHPHLQWSCSVWQPSFFHLDFTLTKSVASRINCRIRIKSASRT